MKDDHHELFIEICEITLQMEERHDAHFKLFCARLDFLTDFLAKSHEIEQRKLDNPDRADEIREQFVQYEKAFLRKSAELSKNYLDSQARASSARDQLAAFLEMLKSSPSDGK